MNHRYKLNDIETAESLLEQIETDFIVSENDKPSLLKLIEDYLWIKANGSPSVATAKWDEVSEVLKGLKPQVSQ
jgi:hypothetical protein